jgi:aspartate racemase
VLGTRYLMTGPVYTSALAREGLECSVPEPPDRDLLDQVIFDELVYGEFVEVSRLYVTKMIRRLAERGCDAVVLGCTEIPLLIAEGDSPLPTLDSTRILARAALARATEGEMTVAESIAEGESLDDEDDF